jgi:hypothetical protein
MRRRVRALAALPSLLFAIPALAQFDQDLPPLGGPGGGDFHARCAPGDILNGFELRAADDVDAIRPICATAYAPDTIGPRHAFTSSFGGDGGKIVTIVCPDLKPSIAAIDVEWEGVNTKIVTTIRLYCKPAAIEAPRPVDPTVEFVGPTADYDGNAFKTYLPIARGDSQSCPFGLVPVGITGRSGIWLDAFGLVCGALSLDPSKLPSYVTSIGKKALPASAPRPQRSICDAAVDARARQSPAAPNLEAQCQAAGGIYRMRPSDYDIERIRARGEQLARMDFMAGRVRSALAAVYLRGFDVGFGIWEGNTAPGPGKQRYRDALPANEQNGFDVAAAYALPRNKYAALVNVGLNLAASDAEIARARISGDGFFGLGFDIASGLFGPASSGAEGSKVLGSGAIAIRGSLNEPAQRGFNSSMALHLSRNYP